MRFLLALALLLLAACDMVSTLKDGLEQSQAVAAELEKTVGIKPE